MDIESFSTIQRILDRHSLAIRHLDWGWALYLKDTKTGAELRHVTSAPTLEDLYKIIKETYGTK
jgi:hypothetical protein